MAKKTKTKNEVTLNLTKEAADLNAKYDKFYAGMRTSLVEAQDIGYRLVEIKKQLGHGRFTKWVAENLKFSYKTAAACMRVYVNRGLLDGRHNLSLNESYKLLPPGNKAKGKPKKRRQSLPKVNNGPGATKNADSAPQEPEPPKPAAPEKDPDKRVIPEHLRPVFAAREQFKDFAQVLSTLKGQVKQAIEANPVAWAQFDDNTFLAAVIQATDCLKLGGPFIVCSYCGGTDSDRCSPCKGTGFLSKIRAQCAARELRQERA